MAAQPGTTKKIFVGGLPQNCSEEVLTNYFMQYGTIVDSVVMKDRDTGNSRGFGFVTYESVGAVEMVMSQYDDHRIEKKWVEVKRAIARDQMPPGGGDAAPREKGKGKGRGDRAANRPDGEHSSPNRRSGYRRDGGDAAPHGAAVGGCGGCGGGAPILPGGLLPPGPGGVLPMSSMAPPLGPYPGMAAPGQYASYPSAQCGAFPPPFYGCGAPQPGHCGGCPPPCAGAYPYVPPPCAGGYAIDQMAVPPAGGCYGMPPAGGCYGMPGCYGGCRPPVQR